MIQLNNTSTGNIKLIQFNIKSNSRTNIDNIFRRVASCDRCVHACVYAHVLLKDKWLNELAIQPAEELAACGIVGTRCWVRLLWFNYILINRLKADWFTTNRDQLPTQFATISSRVIVHNYLRFTVIITEFSFLECHFELNLQR